VAAAAEPSVTPEGQADSAVAEQADARRASRRGGRAGNKPRVDDLAAARSELEAAYAEHVAQSEFAPQAEPADTRRPRNRGRRDGSKVTDTPIPVAVEAEAPVAPEPAEAPQAPEAPPVAKTSRRRGRAAATTVEPAAEAPVAPSAPVAEAAPEAAPRPDTRRKGRGTRKAAEVVVETGGEVAPAELAAPAQPGDAADKPARKAPARSRRPRKPEA